MRPSHVVRPAAEATCGIPPVLDGTQRRVPPLVGRSTRRAGRRPHRLRRSARARPGRAVDCARPLVRGELLRARRRGRARHAARPRRCCGPGDYGVITVGQPHALANWAATPLGWAEMSPPQPRPAHDGDTQFVPPLPELEPVPWTSATRGRGRSATSNRPTWTSAAVAGHARGLGEHADRAARLQRDHGQDDGRQRPRGPAVDDVHGAVRARGASPAGTTTRWRRPTSSSRARSTPRSTASATGLVPGDVAWAGVGCVHEFSNPGPGLVRWLETQAPQPPARHSYRFARDWNYLRDAIGAEMKEAMTEGLVVVVGGDVGPGQGGRPPLRRIAAGRWSCRAGMRFARRRWPDELGGKTTSLAFDLSGPTGVQAALDDVGHGRSARPGRHRTRREPLRDYDIEAAIALVTLKLVGYAAVVHALVDGSTTTRRSSSSEGWRRTGRIPAA